MEILKVENLCKKLSGNDIIKNISFSVEKNEIFGFLGPNGAGKTTTIKTITGLIFPTSGSVKINGYDICEEREKALSNVGAIVESPSLYTYLTGMDNLKLVARLRKVPIRELDKVISIIGLDNRLKDKVSKYSLGMKQRLALGCAMIGEPKLLILDEPTNGLDPTGIIELRNTLKTLVKENDMSIFLSSHQLNEVQLICERVAFINKGEILSVEKVHLLAENSKNLEDRYIELVLKEGQCC